MNVSKSQQDFKSLQVSFLQTRHISRELFVESDLQVKTIGLPACTTILMSLPVIRVCACCVCVVYAHTRTHTHTHTQTHTQSRLSREDVRRLSPRNLKGTIRRSGMGICRYRNC